MHLMLAIDDHALPVRKHVCLHMSKPVVRADPVLVPSPRDSIAPDNAAALFYGTVLHEPDRDPPFRMWYHACSWGTSADWPANRRHEFGRYKDPLLMGPMCHAESHDGIVWTKPSVGQFDFKGSAKHNGLDLPHAITAGVNILRDDDDPDPSRRYKLVYEIFPRYCEPLNEAWGNMTTIATATSPDGLRWSNIRVPFRGQFIEQAALWKHDGKFIVGYQAGDAWGSHFSDGGAPSGRQGLARFSRDFDHWVDGYVTSFVLPEPRDPARRGTKASYDQVHLGVGATSFGNVCVGLYGLWHNHPTFTDNACDFGLAVSNDGLTFREPVPGHVWLAASDAPAPPYPSRALQTNLCQGNGILNVGDETRIYFGRWRNSGDSFDGYYGDVALATLPRDRWAALALFPNQREGCVWTMPLTIPRGARLLLNADGAHGISVEVADEEFNLIESLATDGAGRAIGDAGLDLSVKWRSDAFAALAGKTVRFRINFKADNATSPRLFAATLSSEAAR